MARRRPRVSDALISDALLVSLCEGFLDEGWTCLLYTSDAADEN